VSGVDTYVSGVDIYVSGVDIYVSGVDILHMISGYPRVSCSNLPVFS